MTRILRISLASVLLLAPAFGYIRLGYNETGGGFVALKRTDSKGIQYYINNKIVPGAISNAISEPVKVVTDSSDPVTGIREAFATWNTVQGADVKFLPLKTTDALHSTSDGKNVVMFAATFDDLTALGFVPGKAFGAVAITTNVWYQEKGTAPDGTEVDKGSIADSDILLNPSGTANDAVFSTDGSTPYDVQTVLTHEIGHALGQNHTGLLGSTMFQFSAIGKSAVYSQRLVSSDDRAFASSVYPAAGNTTGTLTGKVTLASGTVVKGALVTMLDTAAGVMLGTITAADGTYSLGVPAGNYVISAEPFNSIVTAANIVGLDAAQVTTGFQHTFMGGATPTQVRVNTGASSTGDFAVTSATPTLTLPFSGFGAAGGRSDIVAPIGISGPVIIPSGQSLDIAFLSGGVDATTVIQVYGPGISVRAGSTRVDTTVTFTQGPLVRATLDITARQTPALATLTLTKGGATLAFSGYFVIVPPKPVFTSKSVVNAASYVGLNNDGVVSPGGLYSIYAGTGSALGPAAFAQNGPYDGYGKLANQLSGVSVTFDGVLAPMFLSFSGQLNVQVPFEVAGKSSTSVQVNYFGSLSDKISVKVASSQPAFFTFTPAGADSLAFGAPDYNLNTATNAVARNGVVVMYGTGLGKLSYDVPTGAGAGASPAGFTGGNSCTLGGTKTVPAAFTGWVFGFVGLAQWNIAIPADSPTGKVTVTCTDPNGNSTQTGTLYIK